MKYLYGFNGVPIGKPLAVAGLVLGMLAATPAMAGCAMEQTASNEIVIRTSVVGNCDSATLRSNLSGALSTASSSGLSHSQAAAQPSSLADIKRTSSQGALWRLANINNHAPLTEFSMPGSR